MSSAAVIGSTGLVGSHILTTLLATAPSSPITTITRRAPKPATTSSSPPSNLNALIDTDTTKWSSLLAAAAPATVFSALGTTRAAAGSLANQWKIDHDLNIELARAARAAGTRTFVFVSSGGTRGALSAWAPYSKMKNGVEDALRELDFPQGAVVLKPGLILGEREEGRAAEGLFRALVGGIGSVSGAARDVLGQEAVVIARAAVRAARLAEQGKAPGKYWVVEAADIIRLGRTEWEEEEEVVEKPAV